MSLWCLYHIELNMSSKLIKDIVIVIMSLYNDVIANVRSINTTVYHSVLYLDLKCKDGRIILNVILHNTTI